jgi:hypothetical protein
VNTNEKSYVFFAWFRRPWFVKEMTCLYFIFFKWFITLTLISIAIAFAVIFCTMRSVVFDQPRLWLSSLSMFAVWIVVCVMAPPVCYCWFLAMQWLIPSRIKISRDELETAIGKKPIPVDSLTNVQWARNPSGRWVLSFERRNYPGIVARITFRKNAESHGLREACALLGWDKFFDSQSPVD